MAYNTLIFNNTNKFNYQGTPKQIKRIFNFKKKQQQFNIQNLNISIKCFLFQLKRDKMILYKLAFQNSATTKKIRISLTRLLVK